MSGLGGRWWERGGGLVFACGKAARRTFPRHFQVFFGILGDVWRAAPPAGRGLGCMPDVPKNF